MQHLLDLRGLQAGYGAAHVLHDIDLFVEPGRITVLLGANGAGKSTLLRAVSRMVWTKGTILLDGEDIAPRTTEQVARRGVAHVPDGRGTFSTLSVAENLALGALALRDPADAAAQLSMALDYFPKLRQRMRQQAGTLSGGEQQMLAIARALMGRPRLLLLDEPSVGLAPIIVQEIFEIMRAINAAQGTAMLLVEQNAARALKLAHHAFVLEAGRVVVQGRAAEVARNPDIRRAYLG
ncbi:ABC transporter ATP-binding protein [Variovorax defluvii]|uniref:ABC transporter ATP-binding protein n=1 Tax=Variovorax defluvii TaxID=913761 RepID=A0ABP8HFQ0_9BURK